MGEHQIKKKVDYLMMMMQIYLVLQSKDENKNNDSSILPSIDLTKDETSEDEFDDGLPPPPDDENESKDEEELPQSKKPKFGQQVLPTGLLAAMGNTKLKSADTGP